ncbi:MAG: hypothetical protein LE178_03065 [Endomicrobium sp.]|nr:hypothetical protein [Endomicrobium sp.]
MIRFKDVTKVVLVLALCFGFAGIGNAEKVCIGRTCYDYDEDMICIGRACYKESKTVKEKDGTIKIIDVENKTVRILKPDETIVWKNLKDGIITRISPDGKMKKIFTTSGEIITIYPDGTRRKTSGDTVDPEQLEAMRNEL